jgi:hypothetical protein
MNVGDSVMRLSDGVCMKRGNVYKVLKVADDVQDVVAGNIPIVVAGNPAQKWITVIDDTGKEREASAMNFKVIKTKKKGVVK